MALRDQPYLPLYIQDIMTDEKLNECTAATHGIYIKGIMCLMHKSETYGKILLKQKHKQNKSECLNFANQLVKHLPYTVDEISHAINDLITEGVCYYEGDYLCQKRMIKDNDLSLKRSSAGKKGGDKKKFALANSEANTENESETDIEINSVTRLTEIETYFNNEQLKISIIKNLKSNSSIILDVSELDVWFVKFLDKIIAEQQLNQSTQDLISWFNNWIKKEYKITNHANDKDLKHFG